MRIEENWRDCLIYLVGFRVEDKRKSTSGHQATKVIHKTVVLDAEQFEIEENCEKVESIIYDRFDNVMNIEYIDLWSDVALRTK